VQVIWRQCGILIPALLFCGCVRPAEQPDGLNLQQGSSHRGRRGAGAARTKGERVQGRRSLTETLEAASPKQERGAAEGGGFSGPPVWCCTDNAAMIGWAGAERFGAGLIDGLDAPARARWPLDAGAEVVRGAGVKA